MKFLLIGLLGFASAAHARYYCEIFQNDILVDVVSSSKPYASGVRTILSDDLSMTYHSASTGLKDEKPSLSIYDSFTGEKFVKYGSLVDPTRALELTVGDMTVKCSVGN